MMLKKPHKMCQFSTSPTQRNIDDSLVTHTTDEIPNPAVVVGTHGTTAEKDVLGRGELIVAVQLLCLVMLETDRILFVARSPPRSLASSKRSQRYKCDQHRDNSTQEDATIPGCRCTARDLAPQRHSLNERARR